MLPLSEMHFQLNDNSRFYGAPYGHYCFLITLEKGRVAGREGINKNKKEDKRMRRGRELKESRESQILIYLFYRVNQIVFFAISNFSVRTKKSEYVECSV